MQTLAFVKGLTILTLTEHCGEICYRHIMRVATYNIHACIGADRRFDADRIVQVLQEIDADVVALQEVEHHAMDGADLLDYLADETGLTAVAGPTLQRGSVNYGNALLAKCCITKADQIDISLPRHEPRGAINATLDWNGQDIQVVATHLGLRPGERRKQVRQLLTLFEHNNTELSILLGDLNEWLLWGRPLRHLHRHFTSTPNLRTYPARLPIFALDRIWIQPRSALTLLETHTSALARIASDHLPLKAELAIKHRAG